MERQIREPSRQDAYRDEMKPAGNPQCPTCRSINVRGRWLAEKDGLKELKKSELSTGSQKKCPACVQLQEQNALGVIELHGETWKGKSDTIFATIENTEQIARARNDQERVLWSRTYRGVTKIYVTLPELARMIGRTLHRAFKGKAEYLSTSEEPFLRVVWNSDEALKQQAAGETAHRSKHWRGRGVR